MIILLLHILGLIVSIIVVGTLLGFLFNHVSKFSKISNYGTSRLFDPFTNFVAIGVIIVYQAYLGNSLQGMYSDIFNGFSFLLIAYCAVCIIINSVGDINDEYGMTKNDYVLRVALNLIFLVTSYGFVYWVIYCISPDSFTVIGVNIESLIRQLWQFWFYSFRVAVTYGDGTIIAIGIPSQIIQVTEVIVFYFVIAKNIEKVFISQN